MTTYLRVFGFIKITSKLHFFQGNSENSISSFSHEFSPSSSETMFDSNKSRSNSLKIKHSELFIQQYPTISSLYSSFSTTKISFPLSIVHRFYFQYSILSHQMIIFYHFFHTFLGYFSHTFPLILPHHLPCKFNFHTQKTSLFHQF